MPRRRMDPDERRRLRDIIAETPGRLRAAVADLDAEQLGTPYRPRGWTLRQVVHHLPDSHVNAWVRFKLALTEDVPTVRPYDEGMWAKLPDADHADVALSLDLLESLHARWVHLIDALEPKDFGRPLVHPRMGVMNVDILLQMYAWHGPHHIAHITTLRERKGW